MPQQPPMIREPEPPAEVMVVLGSLRAHSRPRIGKVRVKWEAYAHNQLAQGHADKFSRFQPKLREHSFRFCL